MPKPPEQRLIVPPTEDFTKLSQPLESGELELIKALDLQLPMHWEIYVQPHLNGLCPDIVLLSPLVGIVVIEVKDWDFSRMSYHWQFQSHTQTPKLLATFNGKTFVVENPIHKAKLYGSEILNLYCPSVAGNERFVPVVCSAVYFSKLSTYDASQFVLKGYQNAYTKDEVIRTYYPVIGNDVTSLEIKSTLPFLGIQSSKYMNEDYAEELRCWLGEPRHKQEQRTPIQLSFAQKEIVSRKKTKSGRRRIRGAAGSGKSLTLAAKAAAAVLAGQSVLVLSYNITLGNYLGDLITRAANHSKGVRKGTTILNYHMWAKRFCLATGYSSQYEHLDWEGNATEVLETGLPNLVLSVPTDLIPESEKYDLILVDEGQDFRLVWWQSLMKALKPEGEAILVADRTQDLYDTADVWTEEAMNNAGFRGPWNELNVSYRLPIDYLPYIQHFLDKFISEEKRIAPEPVQTDLANLQLTHMRWIQVNGDLEAIEACVSTVLELPLRKRRSDSLVYPDITLMAATNKMGYEMVKKLGARGIKVKHTFGLNGEGTDDEIIRRQKVALYLGSEQVKATTIHSFKGWESSCLVVHIQQGSTSAHIAAAYAALTRLKASEKGYDNYITVVCSAPELAAYGRSWPTVGGDDVSA